MDIQETRKREKDAENSIIAALVKAGAYARHVDISIDGFFDIIVVKGEIALVEMKYDQRGPDAPLREVMEPTQPVFARTFSIHGYRRLLICLYDGEIFWLYHGSNSIFGMMNNSPIGSLPEITSSSKADAIAHAIIEEIIKRR